MEDLIKIKGGSGTTPTLQDKELGYNKTERGLYIGTDNGNILLCKADDVLLLAKAIKNIDKLETKPDPAGVFYAVYGTTTSEEINAAYKAGKAIQCKITGGDYKGRILQLVIDSLSSDENRFTFACFNYPIAISTEVNGSSWSHIIVRDLSPAEENLS